MVTLPLLVVLLAQAPTQTKPADAKPADVKPAEVKKEEPKADRSGEAMLRRMFTDAASLKDVHIIVSRATRTTPNPSFMKGSVAEYWRSGNKLHAEAHAYFGDAVRVVNDGGAVMFDPMTDDAKYMIFDPKPFLSRSHGSFSAATGLLGTFAAATLDGPAMMDEMISKTLPIVAITRGTRKGVRVDIKQSFVKLEVFADEIDGKLLPVLVEYAPQGGDFGGLGLNGGNGERTVRENVSWDLKSKPDPKLFATTPPKDSEFEDKRTKKKG